MRPSARRGVLTFLLRAYPRRFREEHGDDLAALYTQTLSGRGPLALIPAWLRVTADILANGLGARVEEWTEGSRSAGRGQQGEGVGRHSVHDDHVNEDGWRGNFMDNVTSDLRYTARGLIKSPGFAFVAILTIALGTGGNTAIFSVVSGVLLEPLPYRDSEELVAVWTRFLPVSGFDFKQFSVDPAEYVDYRDSNRSMDGVAAYYFFGSTLTRDDGDARRLSGVATTWNLFPLLGISPRVGRVLAEDEDIPNGPSVVVLSHALWSNEYGEDPNIVGTAITLGGNPAEVVGVMPSEFDFPSANVDFWTPMGLNPQNLGGRQSHYLNVVARLADGVTVERAEAELEPMMARWAQDYPEIHTGHFLWLRPLLEDRVGNVRSALYLLLGAVGFVLLVVCANVANLLLVQGQIRRKERALRRALGAGRWRIIQQGLTQSVLLAALGGGLGLLLARFGVDALLAMGGTNLPRSHEVGVDGTVVLFTGGLTVFVALLFGLVPALQGSGEKSFDTLKEGGRSNTSGRASLRFRRLLVTLEVALSVLLVIGAGLMMRSVWNIMAESPGYDSDGVLVARVTLAGADYPDPQEALAFFDELLERMDASPNVASVSGTSHLPLMNSPGLNDFELLGMGEPGEGQPRWNGGDAFVRDGYFETMGMSLLKGRTFDESDRVGSPQVVVISESMANKYFAGVDPIGEQIRYSGRPQDPWMTIVGVVSDVKYNGLRAPGSPVWYKAHRQAPDILGGGQAYSLVITARTSGDPSEVAPLLRQSVRELDSNVPITQLQTLDSVVRSSAARPRFLMTLLGLFAGMALLLGAVGIFGVTSFAVAQRSQEIGIRIALGARKAEVARLVIDQGMRPVMVGVAAGLVAALAMRSVMDTLLFEISTTDPMTYVGVSVGLALVALVACYVPAARASRIDPMEALRSE